VAVIGGGNAAVEEAMFLARVAKKVLLIHRRDKLRAVPLLQKRLQACANAEIVWSSVPEAILGKDRLEGLKIKNVLNQTSCILPVDGVFVFIGWEPNTAFLSGLVELDEDGYVITDENLAASCAGIFAAGDCRKKLLRQIVTACSDGAVAAFAAQRYLEKRQNV
jgi:thioredoxin reductase (NADPH)